MPRILLMPFTRLALVFSAGFGGLALKAIDVLPSLDKSAASVVLASLCGVTLLILFLDMANFGYLAIKLKKHPPLGINYVPSLGSTKARAGSSAVLLGLVVLMLGLLLSIVVSIVLISLWMSAW